MPREKKTGSKTETFLAPSLKKKFKAKCKRNNISMAQVQRDLIQKYVKD